MSRLARAVGCAVCVLLTLGIGGTLATMRSDNFFDLMIEVPQFSRWLLILPLLALPFISALPFFALRGSVGPDPAFLARSHYWLVTIFAFLFVWLLWYWKLLGFNY